MILIIVYNLKMSYYSTYRWCGVPECKNTSVKTPDKLWFRVPTDINRRKTWFKVAGRDPELLYKKTRLYFCEDHFDLEQDMENYIQYKIMGSVKRIQLKPDCIPSRKHKSASNESHLDEAKIIRISIAKDYKIQDLKEGGCKASSSCIDGKMEVNIILDSKDQAISKRLPFEVKSEPAGDEVVEHGLMEQQASNLLDGETEIKMESTDKAEMKCEVEVKVEPENVGLTKCAETEEPVHSKEEEYMKAETEWEHDAFHSVSETDSDALATLYPGHEVKDELVLGPQRVQPPDVVFTLREQATIGASRGQQGRQAH